MNIKQQTLHGLKWSFTDNIVSQGLQLVISIILARMLSPGEYGIIGMLMIFIALSQTMVESGLTQALIRRGECSERDYNTVFYTNILIAGILFTLLFFSAGLIARFYHRQELVGLTRFMALNIIVSSFGLVEMTIISKQVNFKLLALITFVSTVISGGVAILMALRGFSYWSLAWKTLIANAVRVLLLFSLAMWVPRLQYSIKALKEMFGYGSRLLLSGILWTAYVNVYYMVIGKYFSVRTLGFYTRAEQFSTLVSGNINIAIQRVTFPVLSNMQANEQDWHGMNRKLIRSSFFITCTAVMLLLGFSRELVLILLGSKWLPCVPYLQIMCLSATLLPLQTININVLKVAGRSDLVLRLEVLKILCVIPTIILGIRYGMEFLLGGMVANSVLAFIMNSWWAKKLVGYSTWQQLKDITPYGMLALTMAGAMLGVGYVLTVSPIFVFIIKLLCAAFILIGAGELFRLPDYLQLKQAILNHLSPYLILRKKTYA